MKANDADPAADPGGNGRAGGEAFVPEAVRSRDAEECRARRRVMHRFARHEFESWTRRVIHRLERREASGVFGNPEHRTLWDEFRHDRSNGPHPPLLRAAFDDIVDGVVLDLVGTVSPHAAALLCEYAAWTESVVRDEALAEDVDVSLMAAHLRSLVDAAALG